MTQGHTHLGIFFLVHAEGEVTAASQKDGKKMSQWKLEGGAVLMSNSVIKPQINLYTYQAQHTHLCKGQNQHLKAFSWGHTLLF